MRSQFRKNDLRDDMSLKISMMLKIFSFLYLFAGIITGLVFLFYGNLTIIKAAICAGIILQGILAFTIFMAVAIITDDVAEIKYDTNSIENKIIKLLNKDNIDSKL